ncbi:hypothetical protein KV205_17295 [Streptomyces sp. SKN60]|uniref:condensation domain-containing protein n=1 Tax=Streptomyces sp. SKN60 TaxID=2855506 RepID=UPI0022464107|nr:condensation domain-containing protein [Streptomyces sp. SKN60]MCX2182272.1 hypothetical protein [Streptomyces sp. SKN60]
MRTTDLTTAERLGVLAGLFAEVLDLDDAAELGPDDDFFDEGGNSLLATRLINAIRTRFRVDLPLKALFRAPTVAGLLALIDTAPSSRPPVAQQERGGLFPTSFAQRRLWVVEQFEATGGLYNMPIALRLRGALDRDALTAALHDVVVRHEVLRTVYVDVDGVPWQRILDPEDTRLAVNHVTTAAESLPFLLSEASRHVFDLATELPIACWLFELGPEEHVLLVALHHIAVDDVSLRPLFQDVSTAYTAHLDGREPEFADLPVQYADYAVWQRELLGETTDPDSLGAVQTAYWRSALAGLPDELALPYDRPRPAVPTFRGDRALLTVDADLHAALTRLAQNEGVSLFMVVHAALATLFARLGAGPDLVVGAPVAGRTDAALDDLVGFFVNTLVLRVDASGQPDLRTLLNRVRSADLDAFAHQDLPFDRLVEALNPSRSLARHPLYQVMLTVLAEDDFLYVPGLSSTEEDVDLSFSRYDMWVGLSESKTADGACAGMSGEIRYSTDVFDASTMRDLADRFIATLRDFVTDLSQRVVPAAAPRTPAGVRRRAVPQPVLPTT